MKNLFIILIIILSYNRFLNAQKNEKNQFLELQAKLDLLNASLSEINNENNKDELEAGKKSINSGNKDIKRDDDIKKNPEDKQGSLEEKTAQKKENLKGKDSISDNETKTLQNDNYEKEKKKTDWIINTINNSTHKERKNAINQILTIKDSSLKKILGEKIIEIIKNEVELEVKIKAITVAGELKLNESVPDLIISLNDESEDVNIAAIYAIKKIKDYSAKQALSEKLKQQKLENHTTLIEALIDTLGEFKSVELIPFASQALKDANTHQITRELLVLFLGKIGSKEPKEVLMELLKDEDENEQIRAFAVNSLANLDIREAASDIEKVLLTIDSYPFNKKKNYNTLYIYCTAALAKFGDGNAVPRLIDLLRSDSASVRLKAIKLIKDIKDKRTIDILKYKRDYDPNPKVQSAAREALIELGMEAGNKSDLKSEEKLEKDVIDETSTD